jgi:hypothetical protein
MTQDEFFEAFKKQQQSGTTQTTVMTDENHQFGHALFNMVIS